MSSSPLHISFKTLERRTVTAAGTITAQRCVGYDGLQITVAGARPWGIAEYGDIVGKQVTIATEGSCVVEAGAAVTIGALLATDAQGRLIPATTGQFVFGRALGAAAQAGRFFEVHITRGGTL